MAETNKLELLDINSPKDVELEGLLMELDLDEDAWTYGAPPIKGAYRLKVFPSKEAWKQGVVQGNDPKDVFFALNIECRIVSDDSDLNDIPVFGRLDTRIFRGKSINTMAGFLIAAGHRQSLQKQGKITAKKLALMAEAALKREPIVMGEVDWKGSYSYINDKGVTTWVNAFNKYEDFKPKADGSGREHIVTVSGPGGNYEVRAQSQITRFFAPGAVIPKYNVMGIVKDGAGAKVNGPAPPTPAGPKVQPIVGVNTTVSPNGPSFIPAPVVTQSQEDIDLMLE